MTDSLAGATATVITVSDSKSSTSDESGPEAARLLKSYAIEVIASTIVPDDVDEIKAVLLDHCDHLKVDLVVTAGGTGVAPRDVTPEATLSVCDRLVPGIPELLRKVSLDKTPHAALSRAVAGIRGKTLVVNLPGSPGGVRDWLQALESVLPHAISLIRGTPNAHRQT